MSCFRHDPARATCPDCQQGNYLPATQAEEAVQMARAAGHRAHTGEGKASHQVVVWHNRPKLLHRFRALLDRRVECQTFPSYTVFTFPTTELPHE